MSGYPGVFGEVAQGLVDQCSVVVVTREITQHTRVKEMKNKRGVVCVPMYYKRKVEQTKHLSGGNQ